MLQRTLIALIGCMFGVFATAQKPTGSPAPPTQSQPAGVVQPQLPALAYKKLNAGLQYAFVVDKPTSPRPQEGDQIIVNMQMVCNDRLMFNTAITFKGKPAVYGVTKPGFKGDIIEAIMFMTPGDSIICLVNADSLFKNTKNKKPDFIKPNDKIQYYIKLLKIKSKEQVQKEQQAAFAKQMKEQMAKQKAQEAKQMIIDDKILKKYFSGKNISPVRTNSGLYYNINEEANTEKPVPGDTVTMNYTGTLLDGTKFDSNEDTAFGHVQPFKFVLGRGSVIKGWEEGVALLSVGSKATFYIPSPMAYGINPQMGRGANPKGIPANSILVFEVRLLTSRHPAPPAPKTDSLAVPITPKQ
jgi:FKBP-type peptidyl-prolyl cis-trans isomerase